MSSPEASRRQARTGENDFRLWVLLDANRLVLAGLLAVVLFLALVGIGAFDPTPLRATVAGSGDPVETAFQALIGGVITGVSLVVTITQLSLSQELGPAGDQRDRMEAALTLQRDVESAASEIDSPDPSAYLALLAAASRMRAADLREAVADNGDRKLRERVDRFADRVEENAEGIETELRNARFGEFAVTRAALNYNYSWKIYASRRLQIEHEQNLSEDETAAFERMTEVLSMFGPAREYFKTQFIQWELVNVSRMVAYTAVPALIVALATVFYVDASVFAGAVFGIGSLTWVVSLCVTIAVFPFLLLLSYMLRIATVSKRSGTTGPFVLREAERLDVFDW